ncbi:MAG: retropepsin-like domain-containing protein, partial [Alistipes sp.]|nr:retropepsin-like domain-containing protein [Alistipes sp.]
MENLHGDSTRLHTLLTELSDGKDYFGFRDAYLANRCGLDAKRSLYWEAVYHNLFGREYRSLTAAGHYLTAYGDKDEDSGEMLYISAVNRLRRFRYRAAAATYRKLLRLHGQKMSAEEKEEATGNLAVCHSLRQVPPQTVRLNGLKSIPLSATPFHHLSCSVCMGGFRGNFILDTGANFSAVSLTTAEAMGLVPVTTGIDVGTATGVRLQCGLAYAPELDIAGITVRNAVFIIMEDGQLEFPEMNYRLEGIIGLPVLRQLGNLKFTPTQLGIGNVRFPAGAGGNVCLEGLMPLAEIHAHGQRLAFTLDTGANNSEYSYGHYNRNRERLDGTASRQRGLRGGGGGVINHKSLMLPDETLSAGGRDMRVPAMNVMLDDFEFSRGKDGNLGLDALMANGGFRLSFGKMA